MKLAAAVAGALALFGGTSVAQESTERPSMQCDVGPLNRTYGASNWLVYGCADQRTLVFITPNGEPAFPFYFMLYQRDGQYQLYGEGTGAQTATRAAYEDLAKLTASDIEALLAETRATAQH